MCKDVKAMPVDSKTILIHSIEVWNQIVTEHQEKRNVLVVYFGASFCGPCRALKPKFDLLSDNFGERVVFVRVDIEELSQVAEKFNVTSVPTTLIIKDCQVAKTIVGADIIGITTGIQAIIHRDSETDSKN